jgi:hypothetical protein
MMMMMMMMKRRLRIRSFDSKTFFFVCVCVEVQSWFTGPIAERGFGSSHLTTPLDELHLMQILGTSDKGVDACEFVMLLIWAAVDGQIGAKPRNNVFEVEVPKDNRPGSIKSRFVKWFMEILEISRSDVHSHVSSSEHEDGKNVACLRVCCKRLLGSLACKILSAVGEHELSCLTHDRLDSLNEAHD